jgi:hypothetical protein
MKEKQKVEGTTEQLLFHGGNKQCEQLNILTDCMFILISQCIFIMAVKSRE